MQKIMFNDRYVLTDAVIDSKKIMTRRIEEDTEFEFYLREYDCVMSIKEGVAYLHRRDGYLLATHRCRYKVGEIVAVAQNYKRLACAAEMLHLTTDIKLRDEKGWTNKTYVKSELMPHQIKITGVRCERLQDISEEDCLAEGIMKIEGELSECLPNYWHYDSWKDCGCYFNTPHEAFASLIDKVSGKGTWDSNPFVWVYEFELIGSVK